MEQDNNNREWDFNVNLSGVDSPGGIRRAIPEGFYKVLISDMYTKPDNPERVVIRMKIAEGDLKGQSLTDGLRIPRDAEDGVRYYWRALAESVGFTPKDLDSGEVSLSPRSFLEKVAHVYYEPKELSSTGYENKKFLTPSVWSQQSQDFTPRAIPQQTQQGGGQGVQGAGSTGGNSGTSTAGDLKSQLGLS